MSTPVPVFEMTVLVTASDIDGQKHVNNTVYLRWVQEVAIAHWQSLAPADAREKIGWVVLRHEIDYQAPANLGDEIVLRTWVGKASGIKFERFTEMLRALDRVTVAQARTLWVPIDSASGKPTRVSAELRARFST